MSFVQEMKDFLEGAKGMSDVRYRNAARRKIDWEMAEPDGKTPSVFDTPGVGGGIGTTDAPKKDGSKSGFGESEGKPAKGRAEMYRRGIRTIESGSPEGNYRAVGNPTRHGNRAIGAYQIMDFNVGPWTKEVLGHEMSVREFMDNPAAQDAVFDAKFQRYVNQFGEKGAAEAWFGGPGAVGKTRLMDVNKMSVGGYGDRFVKLLGGEAAGPQNPNAAKADPFVGSSGMGDAGAHRVASGVVPSDDGAIPDDGSSDSVDDGSGGGATITVVAAPSADSGVEAQQVDDPNITDNSYGVGYARGGAIPDDGVPHYAPGGVTYGTVQQPNPTPMATAYNKPTGSVPHRINIPARDDSWRSWGAGGSPMQKKFREDTKPTAPVTPTPVQQPAMKQYSFDTSTLNSLPNRIAPLYRTQAKGIMDAYNQAHPEGSPSDPVAFMRAQNQINDIFARGSQGYYGNSVGGGSSHGGGFAKGGKVNDPRQAEFDALVKHYEGVGTGGQGGSARDRAARQMNIKYRGINSTAWPTSSPAGGGGRRPSPPSTGGGKSAAGPRGGNVPIPKPRPLESTFPSRPEYPGGNGPEVRGDQGVRLVPPDSDRPAKVPPGKVHFDQITEAIPELPGINIVVHPSGSGTPPGSNGVTIPGVNPPVTGYDVPSGGSWASFGAGGAIPDDPQYFEKGGFIGTPGGSGTTSRTGKRSSAIAGKTTKGGGAPQTKSSTPVRKSANKPQSRNAGKKSSQGRPRTSVPVPTPRPDDQPQHSSFQIDRTAGGVPTPTPRPSPFDNNTVRPEQPGGGFTGRVGHFDQVSELIPRTPPINIELHMPEGHNSFGENVRGAGEGVSKWASQFMPDSDSGDGEPPGSMGVGYPGVNPPVTGTDVPAGGQWPQYARGGAIPDQEGPYPNWRAEEAGYTTSSADANVRSAQPAIPENVGDSPEFMRRLEAMPASQKRPGTTVRVTEPGPDYTPDLSDARMSAEAGAPQPAAPHMRDVQHASRGAVDLGLKGIQKLLGLVGTGAIDDPTSDIQHTEGAQRLASGESAMTPEDVAIIDKTTGVDQMGIKDPGMQQLVRLDKAVNWYLQRGQKDKAEAVAASLLQYGATKVKQAGSFAAAALSHYQESGDPQDLQNAIGFIKLAHQMIPDGFNIDINVDPKTRQLVVSAVDADGQQQKHVVDPAAIPGLLQKAIDGSAYWNSMMQIGQPSIANTRESHRLSADTAEQTRLANAAEWDRRHEIQQGDTVSKEDRAAARKLWEHNNALDEGQTEGERAKVADEQFFADWGERLGQSDGETRQQVVNEGLQYRYDHTKDRSRPLDDGAITTVLAEGTELGDKFGEDLKAVTDIARAIGIKNGALDGDAAANVAGALVTDPITVNPNGTLGVNGMSFVFNPQLLPTLMTLRQKYRQQ